MMISIEETILSQHSGEIQPHGGKLVHRIATPAQRQAFLRKADRLPRIQLNERAMADLEMIAIGGFSPLTGFMECSDYEHVLYTLRLANGIPWPIPVTLSVTEDVAVRLKEGSWVRLDNAMGQFVGVLELTQKYVYSKVMESRYIYGTEANEHPGVQGVRRQGGVHLAGPVWLLQRPAYPQFPHYPITPAETRSFVRAKGWRTVVGFPHQTLLDCAQEYVQKCALEMVDGLFIHSFVKPDPKDDIPISLRLRCCEIVLQHYFPQERVMLALNPAAIRSAGAREVLLRALVCKNYGCSHFIVGGDRNEFGIDEFQQILDQFNSNELGIIPMKFEPAFYCAQTQQMSTRKTSPGRLDQPVELSRATINEMLQRNELSLSQILRPEVVATLMRTMPVMIKSNKQPIGSAR